VHEPDHGWDWRAQRTRATADDEGWRVTGRKLWVPHVEDAALLLVSARTDDGLGWFAVDADDPGCDVVHHPGLDPTTRCGEVLLDGARARRIGDGDATEHIGRVLDTWAIARVADAVGAAGRALELATEYAKIRVQFDQPIGSFQAVQHLLADVLRRVELARAAAYEGARAVDSGDADRLRGAAAVAQAYASDALPRAAADVIQVLGGIGFTWEHDAHLYYRRVLFQQHWLGGADLHRAAHAAEVFA
jgi:alkylation response protein AidB-like acyl-CoA dehydrogenase